jgi:hypothetical protein
MGFIRICWSYLDLFIFIGIPWNLKEFIWIDLNLLGWIGIWWD